MWELPGGAVLFILLVIAGYLGAVAVAAGTVHITLTALGLFGGLLACIAATVQPTKRSGENASIIKDVYAVWKLPIAILLPPLFALLAPLVQYTLTHRRIRRIPPHRRLRCRCGRALLRPGLAALFPTRWSRTRLGLDRNAPPPACVGMAVGGRRCGWNPAVGLERGAGAACGQGV